MDVKQYIDILTTIIGGLVSLVGFLVWRMLHRIEQKLEEVHSMTHSCRESLPERFITRSEQRHYKDEFEKIWEVINYHEHDEDGRVIR
jgi:hypothetical protein